MVKDTWLAKGINDMVELIGGLVNSFGKEGEKEVVRESDKVAIREIDPRVTKQLETMRDDYTGLVIKYVDPLKSNLVQQIIKFGTPEGRLKGTGVQLWAYNAGLQWWNDKRTDIFGQEVKVLPGDQGIAWPRTDDKRWQKLWDYNVNLTDVSPKDKITVKGVPQTLEWDAYLERKKLANDLFTKRFDDYFKGLADKDIKKKLETFTVDKRSSIKTNQIHEDLSDIWTATKSDVNKYMFVWEKQVKTQPKVFKDLMEEGALPDFINEKIKLDKKDRTDTNDTGLRVVPYDKLLKTNDKVMENFLVEWNSFLSNTQVTKEFLESEKTTKSPKDPKKTKYQQRVDDMWNRAKRTPMGDLKAEMEKELTSEEK
jgi:hypothetical protein